jgi:phosphoribosylformylglycinamidine cyclo-ligase
MGKQEEKLSYAKAGVDIAEADKLIRKISPHIRKTFSPEVIGDIGGFSAFFQPDLRRYKNPVFLATTDGVGTKLKVAIATGKVYNVGIDLVGMCVNDMVVHGGKPLFFLDYYATGRLDSTVASAVIKGISRGCIEAGCALIGGETAEMPSMYGDNDFDIAGFCVGIVEKKDIITGNGITEGDLILGITSSGFHSNGYSLIRKVLFDLGKLNPDDRYPGTKTPVWKVLLTPTRIYVRPVLKLLKRVRVRGMAHITGGGFYENIRRILPDGLKAEISSDRWKIPRIFSEIERIGNIEKKEMFRTFNMGIGLVLIIGKRHRKAAREALADLGISWYEIGVVKRSKSKKIKVEVLF